MSWLEKLNGESLAWLLEPDRVNPSIRYFALRDLLDRPTDDPAVREAHTAIMTSGPVPTILAEQHPEGYWQHPGSGYGKYHGTIWQVMLLGELGADPHHERVQRGCEYLLNHTAASNGGFAMNKQPTSSGVVYCLNGNLLYALIQLGYLSDARVQRALEGQVRTITDDEYSQLASTSGSGFACTINMNQPCAWGALKMMKALLAVPPAQRTPAVQRTIDQGAHFLLKYDLAKADYPFTGAISATWFKLGFPLSSWSDVLETLSVLAALGYAADPRLAQAYQWLLGKQDAHGRWKLENSLNGKMWIDIEKRGQPSKWVTLRALRVIKVMEAQPAFA